MLAPIKDVDQANQLVNPAFNQPVGADTFSEGNKVVDAAGDEYAIASTYLTDQQYSEIGQALAGLGGSTEVVANWAGGRWIRQMTVAEVFESLGLERVGIESSSP